MGGGFEIGIKEKCKKDKKTSEELRLLLLHYADEKMLQKNYKKVLYRSQSYKNFIYFIITGQSS